MHPVLPMLGFVSFAVTVAVVSDSASISKISAEPRLIPVAHFLATGSYMVTSVLLLVQNDCAYHLAIVCFNAGHCGL